LASDHSVRAKQSPNHNTPGVDASFELLSRIASDPETDTRYPDGTVLVPADSPDASIAMARAIGERKPIARVFPDGSDMIARPPEASGLVLVIVAGLLWLADRAGRRRDRPTFVPREWVTEFHAAPSRRESELVA
jgi:hypothetical protein